VHQILYSYSYSVVFLLTFEKVISVYEGNFFSNDFERIAQIVGHVFTIQAAQIIEDSPMLASIDI